MLRGFETRKGMKRYASFGKVKALNHTGKIQNVITLLLL